MSEVSKPSKTCSAIVADWLTVYGKVYREEITEELLAGYQLCLDGLRPELLHQAFLRAMKSDAQFRPTPARVLELYREVAEEMPKAAELPSAPMTEEEKKECAERLCELKRRLRLM